MLDGKLVNLRPREMADAVCFQAWLNDCEVTRHLNRGYPFSLASEEAYLSEQASRPLAYDHVEFAIDTKDGVHIGGLGFHFALPEDRHAELGISIGDKSYWSRGYGTDALLTLLRFAFSEMNLHRVGLTVDTDNPRAIACYRKCGFVEEARMRQHKYKRGAYRDSLLMGVLRDEFNAPYVGNQ